MKIAIITLSFDTIKISELGKLNENHYYFTNEWYKTKIIINGITLLKYQEKRKCNQLSVWKTLRYHNTAFILLKILI